MNASSTETLNPSSTVAPSVLGAIAAVWGLFGVVFLLANAVARLAPRALESIRSDLGVVEWIALIACVVGLAYTEGYKAFQKAFSPRVVARAVQLSRRPVWWHALLAPAFCMGFFYATRKRMIVTWVLTLSIIALILLVRLLPMPWRGFVDAGVVVALSWGIAAILFFAARAALGIVPTVDPDLPADR